MIVRDSNESFIMTNQHDHAIFCGEAAKHLMDDYFIEPEYKNDVLLAIREHDRSWIRLDDVPLWNDRINVPYTFMDYPLFVKLPLYTIGINETEKMSRYAALLCSLHYTSFAHIRNSTHPDCIEYLNHERDRQTKIERDLGIEANSEKVLQHVRLLQLFDNISLFVCLNKPGATKEEEHPWYRETIGTAGYNRTFTAKWMNNNEINISPFPFKCDVKAGLKTKHVSKELITRIGIEAAYKETDYTIQEITFVDGS